MSDLAGAFGRLAEARRAMEDGLALLDGASVEDADVPNALGRLASTVAEVGDFAAMRESIQAGDHERFDDELEDLLRLNAVLKWLLRKNTTSSRSLIEPMRRMSRRTEA